MTRLWGSEPRVKERRQFEQRPGFGRDTQCFEPFLLWYRSLAPPARAAPLARASRAVAASHAHARCPARPRADTLRAGAECHTRAATWPYHRGC
eukprot:754186-Prymnesium_polylepis.1